jgi:hypothetical protein
MNDHSFPSRGRKFVFCATQCFSSGQQLKFGSVVNKPKPDLYEFFASICGIFLWVSVQVAVVHGDGILSDTST